MTKRVLLAVFAHPDDECVVAPVLARYAREGADVYLVYATDGEHGVRAHFGMKQGRELGKHRRHEAECVSRELGIKPPIFLGLEDGSLGQFTNPPGKHLRDMTHKLQKVFDELHPNVVVTWGPDGGYGHPDHRLVQDVVTELVQSSDQPIRLYYFGISHESLKGTSGPFSGFFPTNSRYLTVHVPFTDGDLAGARRSFACHKSQFSDETLKHLESFLTKAWSGRVSFRPWFGQHESDSLFS
ncbi:MAG: PIG-L deacetylase family protein [Terriglobales bacterium]